MANTRYTHIVGIHNGFDVDDYYVTASSEEEAANIAFARAGYHGTVYGVICLPTSSENDE